LLVKRPSSLKLNDKATVLDVRKLPPYNVTNLPWQNDKPTVAEWQPYRGRMTTLQMQRLKSNNCIRVTIYKATVAE